MTNNRRLGQRDGNELDICAALLLAGWTIARLAGIAGEPDLLVGKDGYTDLVEVKRPKAKARLTLAQVADGGEFAGMDRRLTPAQARFKKTWRGAEPIVGCDAAEIIRALEARLALHRRNQHQVAADA